MGKSDAIEGIVNELYRFRYDLKTDILSIHLDSADGLVTQGELTGAGDTLLRDQKSGKPVALTVKGWWKRNCQGLPPDSITEIHKQIEHFAKNFEGVK
jgi:hypothetical protein